MGLKIFLSYAREDRAQVENYYEQLLAEHFEPWMDFKKILPGQNWEYEIDRALNDANVIIALLSKNSISKRGFVQREANFALDRLKHKLPTDIYFIPVLLEPCEVPSHIASRIQYIDITMPNAWDQVLASLRLAATQQSIAIEQGTPFGPYNVVTKILAEDQDGHPGHIIDIKYPNFTSTKKSSMANELSAFFESRTRVQCVANRQNPLEQDPDIFPNVGAFKSNNGYWEHFELSYSNENIVSLLVVISTYGAGAAHPNHDFESFNFVTNRVFHRFFLHDLFTDPVAVEDRLSKLCSHSIAREYWQRTGEAPDKAAQHWISEGCKSNKKNFETFSISIDGLTFHFSPYQVAAYALGTWEVFVSFFDIRDLLKNNGPYGFID